MRNAECRMWHERAHPSFRVHSSIRIRQFVMWGRPAIRRANERSLPSTRVTRRSLGTPLASPASLVSEWWAHQDSNLGQAGYEPAALTAELWARISLMLNDEC